MNPKDHGSLLTLSTIFSYILEKHMVEALKDQEACFTPAANWERTGLYHIS